ncbi:branched-subunit amino acid transport protein [Oxalobacteraceae bacterium GrIS 1.11]
MHYFWMILGMAAITVTIKVPIFVLGDRIVLPAPVREALGFVPVTVLTAIIVPMILAPHGGHLELSWHKPQLVAALAATLVCAFTRRQLLTIGAGLLVFVGWQLCCV